MAPNSSSGVILANRFREVVLNGKWIANTNYKDQLSKTTWEMAITKISGLNTIALLAFHLDYYIAGVNQVLEGGTLDIKDKYSFDAEQITCKADWEMLKTKLFAAAERFATSVEKVSEEQLDADFVKAEYGTYRRNIEGMIEHAYYHLGQVVMLRLQVSAVD